MQPVVRATSGPGRRPLARAALRRPMVALALLVGLLAVHLPTGPPAAAQEEPGADDVRLVVAELEAVVGLGTQEDPAAGDVPELAAAPGTMRASVLVSNDGDAELDAVELVVEVHGAVTDRVALRTALDGTGPQDAGTIVLEQDLEAIPPGGVAQHRFSVDGSDAGWMDAGAGITVHPVVLSLVRGSVVLDQVRTAVVWVETPPVDPLMTAVVLPLNTPPGQLLAGTDPAVELRPGAALDRLVRTAEAAPAGLLVPAVDVAVLEDLERAAAGTVPGAPDLRERLLGLLANGPAPVSQAYAAADVAALTGLLGTTDLGALAVAEGRRRLLSTASRAPANVHLADASQSAASLDLVPADVLVVRWDAAAGLDLTAEPTATVPPPVRTTRAASGRTLSVLVGDPWVTDLLADADGESGWPVDAQRVLAETALLHATSRGAPGRALVVLPPVGWDAPGDLGPLLVRRLADATWLAPTTPGALATSRDAVAGSSWSPVPVDPLLDDELLAALAETDDRLMGLAAALGSTSGPRPLDEVAPPDGGPDLDLDDARDALLRAATSWRAPKLDPPARDRVGTVRAAVDSTLGTVEVPDDAAVTLTSERGEIPVTIRHPDGAGLDVVVEVQAQGRLTFEDGERRLVRIEEGSTATVSFGATALARGRFPVVVTVATPDGSVVLEEARLSVNATAVSRTALLVVGVVVLVLLLLGGRRRRRPPGTPHLSVVQPPP